MLHVFTCYIYLFSRHGDKQKGTLVCGNLQMQAALALNFGDKKLSINQKCNGFFVLFLTWAGLSSKWVPYNPIWKSLDSNRRLGCIRIRANSGNSEDRRRESICPKSFELLKGRIARVWGLGFRTMAGRDRRHQSAPQVGWCLNKRGPLHSTIQQNPPEFFRPLLEEVRQTSAS